MFLCLDKTNWGKMHLLDLPDLALETLLTHVNLPSLLNLRLVSSTTKELVERPICISRITIKIDSFQILKSLVAMESKTRWQNVGFTQFVRELSGPTTISNTPEWDHQFSRFLTSYGPFIKSVRSDMLFTFSETDRILALRSLEEFDSVGYVYSIENIMNTKRTFGKYENIISVREDCVLNRLTWLKMEGCTTLRNVLVRTPNLEYLCVTSGIGAHCSLQPGGWRDINYSETVIEAIKEYVTKRFYPLREKDKRKRGLTIDFGTSRADRLLFTDEALEEFCHLCHPVGVIRLLNVRSTWLPKTIDACPVPQNKLFPFILPNQRNEENKCRNINYHSFNCIGSLFLLGSTRDKYIPQSAVAYNCGLTLAAYYPTILFQLPTHHIKDISIYSLNEDVTQDEISQVLRPRPNLLALTILCDVTGLLDECLDFSFFPNLKHLKVAKFSSQKKKFWLMCKHLRQLETLNIAIITENVLLANSVGHPPAILNLKKLKVLAVRRCSLTDKTVRVLGSMELEQIALPKMKNEISTSGFCEFLTGDVVKTLKYLEISMAVGTKEKDEMEQSVKSKCTNLIRVTIDNLSQNNPRG